MAAGSSSTEQLQQRMKVRETVELTEKEERIFRRLLDVVRHFDLGTQLRVAGGWVRDKLLGEEPVDIDIAVDNMTGLDFCMKVNEFMELVGEKKEDIHPVCCNPDKSKHLETARMSVFDTLVDFVNLRSEKYALSSRIPTMEIGTAKEDAYRRDLTINRFDFTLSEDLKDAASDEEVKSELGCKISRERVGQEVDLMMSGKRPVQAMSYIRDLGLFYVVFSFPEKFNPPVFYMCDWCCVAHIEAAWKVICSVPSSVSYPILLDEQRQVYLYSALFIPLHNMFYLDRKSNKIPVASYIIQDALKLSAFFAKSVNSIHTASRKFAELVLLFESNGALGTLKEELEDEYLSIPTDLLKRVYAGLLLDEVKDLWRVVLLISILSYPEAKSFGETLSQQEDELHRRKVKYIKVERSITNLGEVVVGRICAFLITSVRYSLYNLTDSSSDLDGVWKCKPLLTGGDIMRVMQVKACPLIGEWKKRVFKWQLAHPEATMDDCMEWLKQSQSKRQKV